jgi:hypothetical protein
MVKSARQQWKMKPFESEELVFCYNDLSTNKVIVDPETLKVNAIIDWEYAGFYPAQFEGKFFRGEGFWLRRQQLKLCVSLSLGICWGGRLKGALSFCLLVPKGEMVRACWMPMSGFNPMHKIYGQGQSDAAGG